MMTVRATNRFLSFGVDLWCVWGSIWQYLATLCTKFLSKSLSGRVSENLVILEKGLECSGGRRFA